MTTSHRFARLLVLSVLALAVLTAGGCSDDDGDGSASTTVPEVEGDGPGADDADTDTTDGDEIPVLPEVERDFGIATDMRAGEITEAATEHFGDRWAGVSFDIPDDDPPVMRLHVVGPSDADREWVRELVESIEPGWVELVEVVGAEHSFETLTNALGFVIERMNELDLQLPVELDTAGNRVVINVTSVEPSVRDQIRGGLPVGIVLFADEVPDDEDDDE